MKCILCKSGSDKLCMKCSVRIEAFMNGESCDSKSDAFGVLVNSKIFEGLDYETIEGNEEFIAGIAWDACPE